MIAAKAPYNTQITSTVYLPFGFQAGKVDNLCYEKIGRFEIIHSQPPAIRRRHGLVTYLASQSYQDNIIIRWIYLSIH
jgi:hypothetical protein